ncbi:MFS general substrate transporter [Lichtheimia hyalospora FSU 10163]|nr:MFS general substrate transporter [Lichtheimia hyalospora FSU 10163]
MDQDRANNIDNRTINKSVLCCGKQSSDDESHGPKRAICVINSESITSIEERKLVKKINWTLMPLVCLLVGIQFVDKTVISFTAVLGIYEDTGMTHDQFGWLGALFYGGFLVTQFFNQYLLQRLPPSKYVGVVCVVWGITLGCHAFAKSFALLAALRFLLGFWEGVTYPAVFLLISTHYRRSEQNFWFTAIIMVNAMASCIASLIMYGIGLMDGLYGMRAWKWAMIIWGSITTLFGIVVFLFLADQPKSRWFRLTPLQEKIVDERVLDNVVVRNRNVKRDQIIEALKEPRLYACSFISLLSNLQNGAIQIFSSQIIHAMGFSRLMTVIMNIPLSVSAVVLLSIVIIISRRLQDICYVAATSSPVQFLGLILAAMPGTSFAFLQALISSNVSGYTKKIFYTGASMVAYCIGCFTGPLLMLEREAPRYVGAMVTYAIADVVVGLLFVFIRVTLSRENKRRQELKTKGMIPPPPSNRHELDLTDKKDLNFIYRL